MKKALLAITFIAAFMSSMLAGTQFVGFVEANPYVYYHVLDREVAPPNGTKPPTITIASPKNNTAYASNNVSLIFDALMENNNNISLTISEIYYKTSWQTSSTSIDLQALFIANNYTAPSKFSMNLTDVPQGPRWLEVYAVAKGFSHETYRIAGPHYSSINIHYVGFRITGSVVVNFTIDNTSPKVSTLSLENKTYNTSDISLNFNIDESASWLAYSLDTQTNRTIMGNTTLTELSNGPHTLILYANDTAGNMGASETVYFNVNKPPSSSPSPSPSISLSPTISQQQPPSSPEPQSTADQSELTYATAAGAIIIVIIATVTVLTKRKRAQLNQNKEYLF